MREIRAKVWIVSEKTINQNDARFNGRVQPSQDKATRTNATTFKTQAR